jgi:riboflavin synthase
MFTGLVQDLGTVASLTPRADDAGRRHHGPAGARARPGRVHRARRRLPDRGRPLAGRFEVEASPETLRRTTLGSWVPGTRVNLERALTLADRLGGHLVLGHVDAVSRVLARRAEGGSLVPELALERPLAPFLIEKGSVAVDGVSLTVNAVGEDRFSVQLIPETRRRTTLSDKAVGAAVNLETDVLGKYVARLLGKAAPAGGPGGIDEGFLKRCGFQ